MPSFSIVIPTRDRADLVGAAVASAVGQELADVEIVVSDNSTTPVQIEATRAAVAVADPDGRARYVRPPAPMTMPDHWEFASRQADNDYLLILTDRFVMRPGALAILADVIATAPGGDPEIVMWSGIAGYTDDGVFSERPYTGRVRIRSTRSVLAEFAASEQWRNNVIGTNSLPRGLNSAVHRSLVTTIRAAHGRLYAPMAPDYTSAFLQLAHARQQVEIDMPLYAAHGHRSNGQAVVRHGVAHYCEQLGIDPLPLCPLPIDTVLNIMYGDYLSVGRQMAEAFPPIDMPNYLLMNWRELQIKEELGATLDIASMRRAILAAAAGLPSAQRSHFDEGRSAIDAYATARWRLRNRLSRFGVLPAIKAAAMRLGVYRRGPRHADIGSAVQAHQLRDEHGSAWWV